MMNSRALCRLFFTLIVIVVSGVRAWAQRGDVALLPVGQAAAPIPTSHFPDRLHALVFRNWNVVEVDRIATTVGATRQEIEAIAASMGLPSAQPARR